MNDGLTTLYESMLNYDGLLEEHLAEGLSMNGKYRLNRLIHKKGSYTAAVDLVNLYIGRISGGSKSSQSNISAEFTDSISDISHKLDKKEYDPAISLALSTANDYVKNAPGLNIY